MRNLCFSDVSDRSESGQGLLEFAIVIPILMLIVIGLFDLGYAVFLDNMISNAAREGARVGIVLSNTDNDIREQIFKTAPGLNATNSQITIDPSPTRTFDEPVHVTVSYLYKPMTPLLGSLIGGGLRLSSTSTMTVEGVIKY